MAHLTAAQIRGAFSALAGELRRAGARAEIAVAGGAALVLLYGARESTKDVAAINLDASADGAVRVASRAVAGALGLPSTWLNDATYTASHWVSVSSSPRP